MSVLKCQGTNLPGIKYRSCFNRSSETTKNKKCTESLNCIKTVPSSIELRSSIDTISSPSISSKFSEGWSISPITSGYSLPYFEECGSEHVQEHKKEELERPSRYVGFADLPNQIIWRSVRKGFEFTLMVVGESGLGKSTLINSLFLTDIYSSQHPGPTQRTKKTTSVETTTVVLKESGVQLKLTVVDTPGFGDAVDNSNCWTPITEFIERKHMDYFKAETSVNRQPIQDQRVHCCLFFIQPSDHGLKPVNIETMKHLCDKVNIVPVIAKSDTLTARECANLKQRILQDIARENIRIYEFPDIDKEDEDYNLNMLLKNRAPFAVAGSNTVINVKGKNVRGREYPWGVVDIENLDHCDFRALRKMVICTHMEDLKDVTHNVHYENYRLRTLGSTKEPRTSVEILSPEHRLQVTSMKKVDIAMDEYLEQQSRENTQKLKDGETELMEQFVTTKRALLQETKEIEEKRRQFELEKETWEKEHGVYKPHKSRKRLELLFSGRD